MACIQNILEGMKNEKMLEEQLTEVQRELRGINPLGKFSDDFFGEGLTLTGDLIDSLITLNDIRGSEGVVDRYGHRGQGPFCIEPDLTIRSCHAEGRMPLFESERQARAAAKNIGENRIKKMFKVLGGNE